VELAKARGHVRGSCYASKAEAELEVQRKTPGDVGRGVPPRGSLQMLANRTRLQVVRHWRTRSGRASSIAIAIAMPKYRQVQEWALFSR
jgi:hypothetical protein